MVYHEKQSVSNDYLVNGIIFTNQAKTYIYIDNINSDDTLIGTIDEIKTSSYKIEILSNNKFLYSTGYIDLNTEKNINEILKTSSFLKEITTPEDNNQELFNNIKLTISYKNIKKEETKIITPLKIT